ncbi:DUF6695 family protein [Flavobacteriaceae bacterium 14752]|uniref:DUF6695 family protein n=1 Tax=Mesohalobacter salilacus TaxID=2491711 RepID=UPI000F641974|nr:hypothetical protein EIG84_05525 [Flavobacteriaceae bacterium 14752]
MRNPNNLSPTLPEPQRPEFLPKHAQWLAGEGAGSWFTIDYTSKNHRFEITRYSPKGKIECQGLFEIENSNKSLNLNKDYKFIHLSHCAFVHIKQRGNILKLNRIQNSKF